MWSRKDPTNQMKPVGRIKVKVETNESTMLDYHQHRYYYSKHL